MNEILPLRLKRVKCWICGKHFTIDTYIDAPYICDKCAPPLTVKGYKDMMKKKGFHFDV